ncbi:MAG: reverse transcriptase/maturase family protein [Candidatus Paceibacterota bacterium]|jgi:retron-type reverse transcriptase
MRVYNNLFDQIVNLENLFQAWEEFKRGKQKKPDVLAFEKNLEQNIFQLHRDLTSRTYKHGPYSSFYIYDPKRRHIHKATVRDRVLHHAIFRVLNWVFGPTFIPRSFSCRFGKGTHKGVAVLEQMQQQVSHNYSRPGFALKCDVKKFFDTINHSFLLSIIKRRISDQNAIWLLEEIIESFLSEYSDLFNRRGVPIGNLTSQLFANVYMNEFDQFVKHELRVKNYVRYTDDFIVVSDNIDYLLGLIKPMVKFLKTELGLSLHPEKVGIGKIFQGTDFLGYVLLPYHRRLRKRSERRMWRKIDLSKKNYENGLISPNCYKGTINSYLGVLSHANTHKQSEKIRNEFWFCEQ